MKKIIVLFLILVLVVGATVLLTVPASAVSVAVSDQAGLAAIASASDGDVYTLTGDLVLSEWSPIDLPAGVIFDGGGYTLSGLTTPLFANVAGTVRNLTVSGTTFTGSTTSDKNGVIAQKLLDGAALSHVDVADCDISAYYAGGVAAEAAGSVTLEYCTVSGSIRSATSSGNAIVGGMIARYNEKTTVSTITVSHCTNNAALTVTNGNSYVGGIIGNVSEGARDIYTTFNISGCVNNGALSGKSSNNIGGIIGYAYRCFYFNVTDCANNGALTGDGSAALGGIFGSITSGSSPTPVYPVIRNCVNRGVLNGAAATGGVVGSFGHTGLNGGHIYLTDCVNHASVTGTSRVGGLIGAGDLGSDTSATFLHVTGCVNFGDVTGTDNVGGAIGSLTTGRPATIQSTATYGSVSASAGCAGGAVGYQKHVKSASDLTFSGFVQGGDVSGDIVGGLIGRIYAQRQISDYGAPKSTRVSRTFVAYESYTVAPTFSCVIVTGDLEADTAAALIVGLIERNAAPSFSISDLYSASVITADGSPVADPAGYNLLLYVEDEMTTYYNRNVENSSEIMMGVASGSPVSCDLSTSVYDAADLTNYSAVASLTAHQQAETVWAQSDVGPVPVVADIAAHTVTYKTADGAGTLGTRLIIHGNSGVACAPAAPAVASMTFEGWSGSVAAVTSDATVLATYSYREYLSALTFDAAYLTLTDSFAVNMLIALPDDGAIDDALASGDLVVRVICGGESYPITWADLSRGGVDYLRCTFGGLDAARMGETLTYQIRVCGRVVRSVDYSVLIYASRMYQKAGSSEQLKDLLVAMMVYGDAAEQKAGADAAGTVLAAFKTAIGDDSVAPTKDYAALALTDESEGTGVSVALHLGARIEVRFAGLLSTPTVTAGGEDMAVTDNGDGTYSVFVNASGLHLKLCVNSAVTFSVGDYIARGIAGSLFSAAEQAVAQALAVYMDATLTYAGSLG